MEFDFPEIQLKFVLYLDESSLIEQGVVYVLLP